MALFNITKYTKDELRTIRAIIEKAMQSVDDTDAVKAVTLFPLWVDLLAAGYEFTTEDVAAGFRCQYNDMLYRVLQPHVIQEGWNPTDAPSLFAKVLIPDADVVPEWEQPDSTNPYMKGDKVVHNGITYESLVDGNVWEPGTVGTETLWKVVE